MITEAENIILSKQYFELTADELATVSELVQNAEEFEEMKWFLASTQGALAGQKIEASPEMKRKVMEHLNQPKEKRRFWLNGVIPFLLPEDKKFYQKPAFQMSMAAILIIGFILFMPGKIGEDQMAMNDKDMGLKDFEKPTQEIHLSAEKDGEGKVESGEMVTEIPADDAANTRNNQQPGFAELSEIELVEEDVIIDELSSTTGSHDGFYNGPITDADRKRMEEKKISTNGNATTATLANDITVVPGNNNPELAPAVSSSDIGGENKETVDQTDLKGKTYRDANKDKADKVALKKERFDKNNDNFDDDEIVAAEDLKNQPNNESIALGGAVYKQELNQVVTDSVSTIGFETLNADVTKPNEIKPYKLHVNETKELKSLFTTFK